MALRQSGFLARIAVCRTRSTHTRADTCLTSEAMCFCVRPLFTTQPCRRAAMDRGDGALHVMFASSSYSRWTAVPGSPGSTYSFDVENRMVTESASGASELYAYGPDNLRVYKKS